MIELTGSFGVAARLVIHEADYMVKVGFSATIFSEERGGGDTIFGWEPAVVSYTVATAEPARVSYTIRIAETANVNHTVATAALAGVTYTISIDETAHVRYTASCRSAHAAGRHRRDAPDHRGAGSIEPASAVAAEFINADGVAEGRAVAPHEQP